MPGNAIGTFAGTPAGILLHGTRSGRADFDALTEYRATVNYVRNGAAGLGWHATVGPGRLALHLLAEEWGWNARGASSRYIALEFAQPTLGAPITDDQLDAATWWLRTAVLARYPSLPRVVVTHAEIPEGIADGKTDPWPRGDPDAAAFKAKLLVRLG